MHLLRRSLTELHREKYVVVEMLQKDTDDGRKRLLDMLRGAITDVLWCSDVLPPADGTDRKATHDGPDFSAPPATSKRYQRQETSRESIAVSRKRSFQAAQHAGDSEAERCHGLIDMAKKRPIVGPVTDAGVAASAVRPEAEAAVSKEFPKRSYAEVAAGEKSHSTANEVVATGTSEECNTESGYGSSTPNWRLPLLLPPVAKRSKPLDRRTNQNSSFQ